MRKSQNTYKDDNNFHKRDNENTNKGDNKNKTKDTKP